VVFSVNRYTNLEAIERLMRTDTICDFPLPQEKRIYVLEDVDAMGDVVNKRSDSDMPTKNGGQKEEREVEDSTRKKEKKDSYGDYGMDSALLKMLSSGLSRKSENHLSFLLNLLDGVIESPGRIIVMTTNHVNKLDPALIRPGRIDVKIEFRKCSREILIQILEHFYQTTRDTFVLPPEIGDYLFTPAVISRLCRAYKHDITETLTELQKEAALLGGGRKGVLNAIDEGDSPDSFKENNAPLLGVN